MQKYNSQILSNIKEFNCDAQQLLANLPGLLNSYSDLSYQLIVCLMLGKFNNRVQPSLCLCSLFPHYRTIFTVLLYVVWNISFFAHVLMVIWMISRLEPLKQCCYECSQVCLLDSSSCSLLDINLNKELANIFYKGSDGKYFTQCEIHGQKCFPSIPYFPPLL